MVRDGIDIHEVYATFSEGGDWIRVADSKIIIRAIFRFGELYGLRVYAIRRGSMCYDFVLESYNICPWRYVPPIIREH